jgi:hypothetical protein
MGVIDMKVAKGSQHVPRITVCAVIHDHLGKSHGRGEKFKNTMRL